MPELERLLKIHYADKSEAMIHAEKDFDPTERFLEKDLILITYRDLFRSEDRSPLASLAFFLEEAEERRGIINTINILPFFLYTFDRGFSMVDFRSVDPNLGSWRDLEEIGKRFKLMFDRFLNHASSKSLEILEMLNGNVLAHALILQRHIWRSVNDLWKKRATIKNGMESAKRVSGRGKNNVSRDGSSMGPG
jgi:sucrose phosphorylase